MNKPKPSAKTSKVNHRVKTADDLVGHANMLCERVLETTETPLALWAWKKVRAEMVLRHYSARDISSIKAFLFAEERALGEFRKACAISHKRHNILPSLKDALRILRSTRPKTHADAPPLSEQQKEVLAIGRNEPRTHADCITSSIEDLRDSVSSLLRLGLSAESIRSIVRGLTE